MKHINAHMTRLRSQWLMVVPVVLVLVGAWLHHWVAEDAFIDFRVVRNILAGHGPVFNIGQRVEVYTDPLWVALLALVSFFLPFLSVEWWSVILGLGFTALGFGAASSAAVRMAAHVRKGNERVVPIGLLVVSSVAVIWDFATSGLETGMIFGWIGLSWLMLVRAFEQVTSVRRAALVASLGFTIRPDMALLTVTSLVTLWCIERSTHPTRTWRHQLSLLAYGTAMPILSEFFRVGYFGLLTSNTAIAKSASRLWLSQGWAYLWNFLATYWLVIPLLGVASLIVPTWRRLWRDHERLILLVALAPALGGLADAVYVTAIGGDFMHGRMYLPAFFSFGAVSWCVLQRRKLEIVVISSLLLWGVWSFGFARYGNGISISSNGIADERSHWITWSHNEHPVTLSDYQPWVDVKDLLLRTTAHSLTEIVAQSSTSPQHHLLMNHELLKIPAGQYPAHLYVVEDNVGIVGYSLPSAVFIVDSLAISNPVNAHFEIPVRTRPGHEKIGTPPWVIAQFDSNFTGSKHNYFHSQINAAKRALSCWPLVGYLKNISGPLTPSVVWSNLTHAVSWTTMSFPSDPTAAARKLCGPNSRFRSRSLSLNSSSVFYVSPVSKPAVRSTQLTPSSTPS